MTLTPTAFRPQRSKSGCINCRRRKRKCDEQRPACVACQTRRLDCLWPDQDPERTAVVRRRKLQYNKNFSVGQELQEHMICFAAPSDSTAATLLSHFEITCPTWLTIGGDTRIQACIQQVFPVLHRSGLVRTCVLALAAGDRGKYLPSNSGMTTLSQAFYGQALTELQPMLAAEANPEWFPSYSLAEDDALAAVLVLCAHEAINFTESDRIIPHLNAAAMMCKSRSFVAAIDPGLRSLLFEIFCYFFSLVAFTHGSSLRLDVAAEVFASPYLTGPHFRGLLLGPCRPLFLSIFRVAVIDNESSQSGRLAQREAELRHIESEVAQLNLTDCYDTTASDDRLVVRLYQTACLIYVRRVILPNIPVDDPEIQRLVLQFIQLLRGLCPASPVNGILCWPLVIAGLAAIKLSHRRLIAGRIRKVNEKWPTEIFSNSANILSSLWRDGEEVDASTIGPSAIPYQSGPGTVYRPFSFPIILV